MSTTDPIKRKLPAGIYRRGASYLVRVRSQQGSIAKSFTDLKAARSWQRNTQVALERGELVIHDGKLVTPDVARTEGRTLCDAIKRYQRDPDCRISPSLLQFFNKRLGEVALVELGTDQIAEALETIDRTPATRNRYRAAIHRLLTVAVREWRWLDHNPASGVKLRKENNRRDVVFSKDDEEQLLAACEKADPRGRLPLLFRLGLATGARAGELIGLTWGDLDLAAGTARLGRTKNHHPRTLVVRGPALEALRRYAKVQPINSGELVFTNDRGDAPFILAKWFRRAAAAVNLDHVRFHDTRHTFATRFARTPGVTLTMLRDALGHRTLMMVQRYAHEQTDAVAEALERMHAGT